MKKSGLIAIFALFTLVISGCGDKEDYSRKSAMLFYMAANNNLDEDIYPNVNTILSNFVPDNNKDLYVFYKGTNIYGRSVPTLYRIEKKKDKAELVTVKTYDKSLNSALAGTLDLVMNDLSALPEVTVIDDILLSSHANSWLPLNKDTKPLTRGIGVEGNSPETIRIDEMALIFEKFNLNSIIFDACFMGSIEVVYQLRNSAKYILASTAEIYSEGMNYAEITKYFTKHIGKESLMAMAKATNDMYNSFSPQSRRSCTMLLTECSELENLGTVVKGITSKYASEENNKLAAPKIRYDNPDGYAKDYKEYLYNLIDMHGGTEKAGLDAAWAKTFYYVHTDYLFGIINLTNSNGVAGYIIRSDVPAYLNEYYRTLDWAKYVLNI